MHLLEIACGHLLFPCQKLRALAAQPACLKQDISIKYVLICLCTMAIVEGGRKKNACFFNSISPRVPNVFSLKGKKIRLYCWENKLRFFYVFFFCCDLSFMLALVRLYISFCTFLSVYKVLTHLMQKNWIHFITTHFIINL